MARKKSALVGLMTRLREPLRKKLELAAKGNGVSLNAEINNRLEASLDREDAFGGREHYRTALLMASAFATAAGNHEQGSSEAYIAGMAGVLRSLMGAVRLEDQELAAAYLKSVFLTKIANNGGDNAR